MKCLPNTVKYSETLNHTIKSLLMIIIVLIVSCAENSDRLVKDTTAIKQFNIEVYNDENLSINTTLIEQVIVIKGIVKDINHLNNRSTIILKGKYSKRLVICDMQDNQNIEVFNVGDTLAIKGILKGNLKDIILLNCLITNTQ